MPQDGGRGTGLAVLGFAAFGAFWGAWGASLPRLQLSAGVTDAELGAALSFIGIGALLSIRPVGGLADRGPAVNRWLVPATLLALGIAGAAPAFVRGPVALGAALLVLGACSGAADAAINATASSVEASGPARLHLVHGVFSVAVVVGSLVTAAVTGTGRTGRPGAVLLVGGGLVLASLAAVALPRPAGSKEPRAAGGAGERAQSRGRSASGRSRRIIGLGLLAAAAYLIENAWQSWAAIRLHAGAGATLRAAALGPAVFGAAAACGRLGGHALPSRVPERMLFAAGASCACAGGLTAALAPLPAVVFAGLAAAGVGTSVCAPTLISLAGRGAGGSRGAATASVITVAYLGFVLGPAAVGLLAGAATLSTALVAVSALAGLLALAAPALRSGPQE